MSIYNDFDAAFLAELKKLTCKQRARIMLSYCPDSKVEELWFSRNPKIDKDRVEEFIFQSWEVFDDTILAAINGEVEALPFLQFILQFIHDFEYNSFGEFKRKPASEEEVEFTIEDMSEDKPLSLVLFQMFMTAVARTLEEVLPRPVSV